MQKPIVRLHLFFATENDRAVILRQGPTRQYRMILWHRDTDRFEDGQWIKKRIYVESCDLSPDGAHFIYFALDGKWNQNTEGAYTCVSKPPYWTALSLCPEGSTWSRGGVFLDNTHYYAVGGPDIIGRDEGLSRVKLGEPSKGCTTGIRLMNGERAPLDRTATKRLLGESPPEDIYELYERMPVQRDGLLDRYDTKGGCLYRRRGQELELIRDFNDMEFEEIRAPYDWRDKDADSTPWHPLDQT